MLLISSFLSGRVADIDPPRREKHQQRQLDTHVNWLIGFRCQNRTTMMETYFQGGSAIQADNLHTFYLMSPNRSGYPVSYTHHQHQQQPHPPPPNMPLLNPAAGADSLNLGNMPQGLQPSQNFVGIPLPRSDDLNRPSPHEIPALHGLVPRVHYNLWSSLDPAAVGSHTQIPTAMSATAEDVVGLRRPVVTDQQGLFLSLSPHHNGVSGQQGPTPLLSPTSCASGEETRMPGASPSAVSVSLALNGLQNVILGSKYLDAAQQLLGEVVSLRKSSKAGPHMAEEAVDKKNNTAARKPVAGEGSNGGEESSCKRGVDLTTAQRLELQKKKAKLLNMLDEVEQKYKQYNTQMHIVVTSLGQAARVVSARTYTALASKIISKQFRCLKDAIAAQIKGLSKSLGEDDAMGGKGGVEEPRLRPTFVDHQLQQRQPLGMVQHNAWRPQRGLPEQAVSVLRAWLFDHFLHPYPKDSDKHKLAKQTGLTRNQVSNWFINARVRLWKPMVEEIYTEEMKAREHKGSDDTNSSKNDQQLNKKEEDGSTARIVEAKTLQRTQQEEKSTIGNRNNNLSNISTLSSAAAGATTLHAFPGFSLIGSPEMVPMVPRSPPAKKQRRNDMRNSLSSILSTESEMKPQETSRDLGHESNRLLASGGPNHGFGAHQIVDARFHGNGVSLTLGPPRCENLSLTGTHRKNYIPSENIQLARRLEMGTGEPDLSLHSTASYEMIDIQNRKRLAAQPLPDFVA
ncbi:hypothetical protein Nepgr_009188 [Nepenthes gracilis]|uniref:Homeobox domain-containing protein n=1 Tax=Nepenthes gracilis TaxID=150966 RepID=A0AAD3XJX5_NEPGR|nr:hypothetical protein Nepgr_009188 [Nepenthes gracilis]